MGALRFRLVLVGLCGLVSACTVSTRTPPEPSTAKSTQTLGIEASPAIELLPSEPNIALTQTPGGSLFWDGTDYVGAVPGWRMGDYWFRIPLDGGRPVIHLVEDGGHSLGDADPISDALAIDGGALLLRRDALVRVDGRGRQVSRVRFSGNEDAVHLLSQQFLGVELHDGGGSLDEIGLSDGGVSIVRSVALAAPQYVRVVALSGTALATLSGTWAQASIVIFDTATGVQRGSVSAPPNQGLTIGATPTGFMVVWIVNGRLSSRALDRTANWTEPETIFSPGPSYGPIEADRLPDGGVFVSWNNQGSVFIAGRGGAATVLPVPHVSSLSCDGPVCAAFADGTGYFFEPGAPSARAQQLIYVRPWQWPTPFSWNGRIWVVLDEDIEGSLTRRRRLTVFNEDAGRLTDMALLPILPENFVIAGSRQGPALTTDGTLFQILTEVDGGVVLGPLRRLVTAGSPPVAPRLFSHEGSFLVLWGASGNGFTVLNSQGGVIVPAQGIPRALSHDQIGVGTPPGEFWLTFREFLFGSPLEVLRVSLRDGGLEFGTPPGLAIANAPESMLLETPLGFVLRDHDGGLSAPFGPVRNGPTVWTGEEFHIYPGPSRVVDSGVVDTRALPWPYGSISKVASDGRGTTLQTFMELEWDWLSGRSIGRARGYVIRNAALPLGRACVLGSDCQSSHCVDSVCCNTACGSGAEDCQACSSAAGSTVPDGVCGPVNTTVVCRWEQDFCDASEYCDGVTTVCPPDRLHDAGFVCRPFQGLCDIPERCDGVTSTCPTDAVSPQGTPCDDDNECTVNDVCFGMYQGWGACNGTTRTGACDAGSPCFIGDSCQNGYCMRGPYCPAPECQVSNGCAFSGCLFGPAPDGEGCDGGSCRGGVCQGGGLDGGEADGGGAFDGGSIVDAGLSVDGGGTSDGGMSHDGGASVDGGSIVDAGLSVDGGLIVDAGLSVDGGGTADGGASRDGGAPFDAGPSDAGVSFDAGAALDAGRVDSGSPDASTPDVPDSGSVDGSDGGRLAAVGAEAGPLASGLGCASSGGSSLAAVLAVLLLRRRFRQPKRPAR